MFRLFIICLLMNLFTLCSRQVIAQSVSVKIDTNSFVNHFYKVFWSEFSKDVHPVLSKIYKEEKGYVELVLVKFQLMEGCVVNNVNFSNNTHRDISNVLQSSLKNVFANLRNEGISCINSTYLIPLYIIVDKNRSDNRINADIDFEKLYGGKYMRCIMMPSNTIVYDQ